MLFYYLKKHDFSVFYEGHKRDEIIFLSKETRKGELDGNGFR